MNGNNNNTNKNNNKKENYVDSYNGHLLAGKFPLLFMNAERMKIM